MRRFIIIGAVLTAALALGGCSSAGSADSSTSSAAGGSIANGPAADSSVAKAEPSPSTDQATDLVQREIVTTADVTIKTASPTSAADRAAQLAEQLGGRVDDRTQTAATKTERATASLTLRVPATKVTTALARLKPLGKVLTITMSSDDVTTQGQDLDARITALSTSVTRLLKLESKATNPATLIEFENDISTRQGELNSLVAQRRYLSDQVAMSTISLRLVAPQPVPVQKSTTPAAAAGAGFAGFAAFFTGLFLVLSYLLPWLLLAAAIVAVSLVVVRRRRRNVTS